MAITIVKKAVGTFEHLEGSLSKIDGYPNATGIGDYVDFKTRNGAMLFGKIPVSQISVIDETTGTTYPPHATVVDLFQTLRAIGYFTMASGGGGSDTLSGLLDTSFTDLLPGDVLTYNGTIWVNTRGGGGGGVTAVNGDTGPEIWLTTDSIPEGNNLYFTQDRVSENEDVQDAIEHINNFNNPHQVTKGQVGLGNVDNTSDADKPISSDQQAAFDLLTAETAIIVNRDYNAVEEANNDIALNDLIANYPDRPAGVFNQGTGRIYTYDWITEEWKDSASVITAQDIIDALGYTPAQEGDKLYYDTSEYQEGIENDLSDLVLTTPFALVQTNEEKFYFVSASGNLEKFQNSRIYLLDSEEYFDLGEPDISTSGFSAWEISTAWEYIQGSEYRFNWWLKESGKGKVKYVGNYPTLADLEQYNPTANDGDTGIVNTEFGDVKYTWYAGSWKPPADRAEQQIDYLVASDLPGHIQNSINF